MKHKTIAYLIILAILINFAYAEQYFALSVNYIHGSLTFNSINLKELDKSVSYPDQSGFLIKAISFENKGLKKIYRNMSENKNYIIYVPYDKAASRIEIYNPSNSKIMDIDVSSFADTCGNKICEAYESYESCREDCQSGAKDDFCDGIKDGICDPDCPEKLDYDCQQNKQNENAGITNQSQSIQNKQITSEIKNDEIFNNLSLIFIGIGSLLIGLLIFLFFKKRKEIEVISMLKQYIAENIRRGFTLEQIKQALSREGYSEKEINKAIKTI